MPNTQLKCFLLHFARWSVVKARRYGAHKRLPRHKRPEFSPFDSRIMVNRYLLQMNVRLIELNPIGQCNFQLTKSILLI